MRFDASAAAVTALALLASTALADAHAPDRLEARDPMFHRPEYRPLSIDHSMYHEEHRAGPMVPFNPTKKMSEVLDDQPETDLRKWDHELDNFKHATIRKAGVARWNEFEDQAKETAFKDDAIKRYGVDRWRKFEDQAKAQGRAGASDGVSRLRMDPHNRHLNEHAVHPSEDSRPDHWWEREHSPRHEPWYEQVDFRHDRWEEPESRQPADSHRPGPSDHRNQRDSRLPMDTHAAAHSDAYHFDPYNYHESMDTHAASHDDPWKYRKSDLDTGIPAHNTPWTSEDGRSKGKGPLKSTNGGRLHRGFDRLFHRGGVKNQSRYQSQWEAGSVAKRDLSETTKPEDTRLVARGFTPGKNIRTEPSPIGSNDHSNTPAYDHDFLSERPHGGETSRALENTRMKLGQLTDQIATHATIRKDLATIPPAKLDELEKYVNRVEASSPEQLKSIPPLSPDSRQHMRTIKTAAARSTSSPHIPDFIHEQIASPSSSPHSPSSWSKRLEGRGFPRGKDMDPSRSPNDSEGNARTPANSSDSTPESPRRERSRSPIHRSDSFSNMPSSPSAQSFAGLSLHRSLSNFEELHRLAEQSKGKENERLTKLRAEFEKQFPGSRKPGSSGAGPSSGAPLSRQDSRHQTRKMTEAASQVFKGTTPVPDFISLPDYGSDSGSGSRSGDGHGSGYTSDGSSTSSSPKSSPRPSQSPPKRLEVRAPTYADDQDAVAAARQRPHSDAVDEKTGVRASLRRPTDPKPISRGTNSRGTGKTSPPISGSEGFLSRFRKGAKSWFRGRRSSRSSPGLSSSAPSSPRPSHLAPRRLARRAPIGPVGNVMPGREYEDVIATLRQFKPHTSAVDARTEELIDSAKPYGGGVPHPSETLAALRRYDELKDEKNREELSRPIGIDNQLPFRPTSGVDSRPRTTSSTNLQSLAPPRQRETPVPHASPGQPETHGFLSGASMREKFSKTRNAVMRFIRHPFRSSPREPQSPSNRIQARGLQEKAIELKSSPRGSDSHETSGSANKPGSTIPSFPSSPEREHQAYVDGLAFQNVLEDHFSGHGKVPASSEQNNPEHQLRLAKLAKLSRLQQDSEKVYEKLHGSSSSTNTPLTPSTTQREMQKLTKIFDQGFELGGLPHRIDPASVSSAGSGPGRSSSHGSPEKEHAGSSLEDVKMWNDLFEASGLPHRVDAASVVSRGPSTSRHETQGFTEKTMDEPKSGAGFKPKVGKFTKTANTVFRLVRRPFRSISSPLPPPSSSRLESRGSPEKKNDLRRRMEAFGGLSRKLDAMAAHLARKQAAEDDRKGRAEKLNRDAKNIKNKIVRGDFDSGVGTSSRQPLSDEEISRQHRKLKKIANKNTGILSEHLGLKLPPAYGPDHELSSGYSTPSPVNSASVSPESSPRPSLSRLNTAEREREMQAERGLRLQGEAARIVPKLSADDPHQSRKLMKILQAYHDNANVQMPRLDHLPPGTGPGPDGRYSPEYSPVRSDAGSSPRASLSRVNSMGEDGEVSSRQLPFSNGPGRRHSPQASPSSPPQTRPQVGMFRSVANRVFQYVPRPRLPKLPRFGTRSGPTLKARGLETRASPPPKEINVGPSSPGSHHDSYSPAASPPWLSNDGRGDPRLAIHGALRSIDELTWMMDKNAKEDERRRAQLRNLQKDLRKFQISPPSPESARHQTEHLTKGTNKLFLDFRYPRPPLPRFGDEYSSDSDWNSDFSPDRSLRSSPESSPGNSPRRGHSSPFQQLPPDTRRQVKKLNKAADQLAQDLYHGDRLRIYGLPSFRDMPRPRLRSAKEMRDGRMRRLADLKKADRIMRGGRKRSTSRQPPPSRPIVARGLSSSRPMVVEHDSTRSANQGVPSVPSRPASPVDDSGCCSRGDANLERFLDYQARLNSQVLRLQKDVHKLQSNPPSPKSTNIQVKKLTKGTNSLFGNFHHPHRLPRFGEESSTDSEGDYIIRSSPGSGPDYKPGPKHVSSAFQQLPPDTRHQVNRMARAVDKLVLSNNSNRLRIHHLPSFYNPSRPRLTTAEKLRDKRMKKVADDKKWLASRKRPEYSDSGYSSESSDSDPRKKLATRSLAPKKHMVVEPDSPKSFSDSPGPNSDRDKSMSPPTNRQNPFSKRPARDDSPPTRRINPNDLALTRMRLEQLQNQLARLSVSSKPRLEQTAQLKQDAHRLGHDASTTPRSRQRLSHKVTTETNDLLEFWGVPHRFPVFGSPPRQGSSSHPPWTDSQLQEYTEAGNRILKSLDKIQMTHPAHGRLPDHPGSLKARGLSPSSSRHMDLDSEPDSPTSSSNRSGPGSSRAGSRSPTHNSETPQMDADLDILLQRFKNINHGFESIKTVLRQQNDEERRQMERLRQLQKDLHRLQNNPPTSQEDRKKLIRTVTKTTNDLMKFQGIRHRISTYGSEYSSSSEGSSPGTSPRAPSSPSSLHASGFERGEASSSAGHMSSQPLSPNTVSQIREFKKAGAKIMSSLLQKEHDKARLRIKGMPSFYDPPRSRAFLSKSELRKIRMEDARDEKNDRRFGGYSSGSDSDWTTDGSPSPRKHGPDYNSDSDASGHGRLKARALPQETHLGPSAGDSYSPGSSSENKASAEHSNSPKRASASTDGLGSSPLRAEGEWSRSSVNSRERSESPVSKPNFLESPASRSPGSSFDYWLQPHPDSPRSRSRTPVNYWLTSLPNSPDRQRSRSPPTRQSSRRTDPDAKDEKLRKFNVLTKVAGNFRKKLKHGGSPSLPFSSGSSSSDSSNPWSPSSKSRSPLSPPNSPSRLKSRSTGGSNNEPWPLFGPFDGVNVEHSNRGGGIPTARTKLTAEAVRNSARAHPAERLAQWLEKDAIDSRIDKKLAKSFLQEYTAAHSSSGPGPSSSTVDKKGKGNPKDVIKAYYEFLHRMENKSISDPGSRSSSSHGSRLSDSLWINTKENNKLWEEAYEEFKREHPEIPKSSSSESSSSLTSSASSEGPRLPPLPRSGVRLGRKPVVRIPRKSTRPKPTGRLRARSPVGNVVCPGCLPSFSRSRRGSDASSHSSPHSSPHSKSSPRIDRRTGPKPAWSRPSLLKARSFEGQKSVLGFDTTEEGRLTASDKDSGSSHHHKLEHPNSVARGPDFASPGARPWQSSTSQPRRVPDAWLADDHTDARDIFGRPFSVSALAKTAGRRSISSEKDVVKELNRLDWDSLVEERNRDQHQRMKALGEAFQKLASSNRHKASSSPPSSPTNSPHAHIEARSINKGKGIDFSGKASSSKKAVDLNKTPSPAASRSSSPSQSPVRTSPTYPATQRWFSSEQPAATPEFTKTRVKSVWTGHQSALRNLKALENHQETLQRSVARGDEEINSIPNHWNLGANHPSMRPIVNEAVSRSLKQLENSEKLAQTSRSQVQKEVSEASKKTQHWLSKSRLEAAGEGGSKPPRSQKKRPRKGLKVRSYKGKEPVVSTTTTAADGPVGYGTDAITVNNLIHLQTNLPLPGDPKFLTATNRCLRVCHKVAKGLERCLWECQKGAQKLEAYANMPLPQAGKGTTARQASASRPLMRTGPDLMPGMNQFMHDIATARPPVDWRSLQESRQHLGDVRKIQKIMVNCLGNCRETTQALKDLKRVAKAGPMEPHVRRSMPVEDTSSTTSSSRSKLRPRMEQMAMRPEMTAAGAGGSGSGSGSPHNSHSGTSWTASYSLHSGDDMGSESDTASSGVHGRPSLTPAQKSSILSSMPGDLRGKKPLSPPHQVGSKRKFPFISDPSSSRRGGGYISPGSSESSGHGYPVDYPLQEYSPGGSRSYSPGSGSAESSGYSESYYAKRLKPKYPVIVDPSSSKWYDSSYQNSPRSSGSSGAHLYQLDGHFYQSPSEEGSHHAKFPPGGFPPGAFPPSGFPPAFVEWSPGRSGGSHSPGRDLSSGYSYSGSEYSSGSSGPGHRQTLPFPPPSPHHP